MYKVLHLIDTYKIGGPGKTILNSARFINKDKFIIYIAFFLRENDSEFSKEINRRKIKHLALKDGRGVSTKNVFLLNQFIKQNKIDLLHTHGFKTDFYAALVRIINKKIKLVTTQHGWINNDIKAKIYNYIDIALFPIFESIIFVSNDMARKIRINYKFRKKLKVIYNAIVIEDYLRKGHRYNIRKKLSVNDSEILLAVIGRLSKEKGCFEMLNAFKKLSENNQKLKLVYIGDGPIKKQLEDMTRKFKLNDRVFYTGHVYTINNYYDAIDILICPSKTEGLSNTILEGLTKKIPVIATDVGGNKEIINNEMNGILIKNGDLTELGFFINKVEKDRALRNKIIKNGFETIKKKFEFKNRMKIIENLYEELIINEHRNQLIEA